MKISGIGSSARTVHAFWKAEGQAVGNVFL
jgi:hypothetical protein